MGNNQKRQKRGNIEYQKQSIIRCNYHHKPVFDTDSCSNILLKDEANTTRDCKHCQYAY